MNYKKKLKEIKNEDIYIIGDVHGCYYTLLKLLNKLPNNVFIIFLGDLCDKGNFTKEVIQLIINKGFISLMGNHDYMMNKYIKMILTTGKNNVWSSNESFGGYKTIKSYQENNCKELEEHLNFINKLPNYIKIDNLFLTHGFGIPYFKRKTNSQRPIMSNRVNDTRYKKDWEDFEKYKIVNIFGHCDFNEIECDKNYIGIDTGCAYGNKLTAIKLNSIVLDDMNKVVKEKLVIVEQKTESRDIN